MIVPMRATDGTAVGHDGPMTPSGLSAAEEQKMAAEYDRLLGHDRPREVRSQEARALSAEAPTVIWPPRA